MTRDFVKRGIGFRRRIAGLCALLVLHAIGMSGGAALAQGPASNLPEATAMAGMTHCAQAQQAAANVATAASVDSQPSSADCSGCCKVQHSCPGSCACPASAANVGGRIFLPIAVVAVAALPFTAISLPAQPPLRLLRPPIAA